MKKYKVTLSKKELTELDAISNNGKKKAQHVLSARFCWPAMKAHI